MVSVVDTVLLVQNVALLNQFICPHSGQILQPSKTGKFVERGKRRSNDRGREGVMEAGRV